MQKGAKRNEIATFLSFRGYPRSFEVAEKRGGKEAELVVAVV